MSPAKHSNTGITLSVVRPSVCPSVCHTFLSHFPKLWFAGDTCIPRIAATIFEVKVWFLMDMRWMSKICNVHDSASLFSQIFDTRLISQSLYKLQVLMGSHCPWSICLSLLLSVPPSGIYPSVCLPVHLSIALLLPVPYVLSEYLALWQWSSLKQNIVKDRDMKQNNEKTSWSQKGWCDKLTK